jgi:hypothetical protein
MGSPLEFIPHLMRDRNDKERNFTLIGFLLSPRCISGQAGMTNVWGQ